MNDEELQIRLRHAYAAATDERTEAQPPDFDAVWNAAEIRAKRRNRWPAVAAAFMAAVAICTQ